MTAASPAPLVPRGSLLVVHAHPDDETLATGGLLATWAASGERVTLVTCTRGERGEVIGDELAHLEGDGAALAAHREDELDAALAALGVQEHVYLDQLAAPVGVHGVDGPRRYEDSGMAWIGDDAAGLSGQAGAAAVLPADALVAGSVDEQAARLAELIRARRPDVVVTYEPGGGYGHPDHVRAHEITMRALELATAPSAAAAAHTPQDVWWTVVPAQVLRRAREELRDAVGTGVLSGGGATLPDPDGPLPALAADLYPPEVSLDVRPVLDRVEDALRAHTTQVQAVSRTGSEASTVSVPLDATGGRLLVGTYALSNDILVPWIGHEYFARATTAPERRPVQPAPSVER